MSSTNEFKESVAESMKANPADVTEIDSADALAELAAMDFCCDLITRLTKEHPEEFKNHRFFRWTPQMEDVHIVWGHDKLLSIQVDPYCQVICAFSREFGNWDKNGQAVDSFLNRYSEYLDERRKP